MDEKIAFSLVFFWLGFSLVTFIFLLKKQITVAPSNFSEKKPKFGLLTRLVFCGFALVGAMGMVELIMLRGGTAEISTQIVVLGALAGLWGGYTLTRNS